VGGAGEEGKSNKPNVPVEKVNQKEVAIKIQKSNETIQRKEKQSYKAVHTLWNAVVSCTKAEPCCTNALHILCRESPVPSKTLRTII
jgi:hypothetical protein